MSKKTVGASLQRNPEKVQPVIDGQVFVNFNDEPSKISLDGVFEDDWETVGILEDGAKNELNRTIEKTKTQGWGFGVIAVSAKPGELTGSVSALERNATIDRIQWFSKKDGVEFHDGEIAQGYVAYVHERQDGSREIRASRHKAFLTIEDIGEQEEVFGRTISIDFMPGKDKDVFDTMELGARDTSASPVSQIRFADPDEPQDP